mmetsp:Transcript_117722/g.293524  ORF Transcript_117722/g.293524 Transcript_117722/m.293524 type:complete len:202 (-) Transcript_117722:980-1585(-)
MGLCPRPMDLQPLLGATRSGRPKAPTLTRVGRRGSPKGTAGGRSHGSRAGRRGASPAGRGSRRTRAWLSPPVTAAPPRSLRRCWPRPRPLLLNQLQGVWPTYHCSCHRYHHLKPHLRLRGRRPCGDLWPNGRPHRLAILFSMHRIPAESRPLQRSRSAQQGGARCDHEGQPAQHRRPGTTTRVATCPTPAGCLGGQMCGRR